MSRAWRPIRDLGVGLLTVTGHKEPQASQRLRDLLHHELAERLTDRVHLNGHPTRRLPNTLNISITGTTGRQLLAAASEIAASTGSACQEGSAHPSPVPALSRRRAGPFGPKSTPQCPPQQPHRYQTQDWLQRCPQRQRTGGADQQHDLGGIEVGVVGMAVGASFAVLVAEQLAASGAELVISITSAGQLTAPPHTPCFLLIDRALRDEGTSLHYQPPGRWSHLDPTLRDTLTDAFGHLEEPVLTGASWTTDAPYRETAAAISAARAEHIACVEMVPGFGNVLRTAYREERPTGLRTARSIVITTITMDHRGEPS